jgi:hypothetical protein
MRMTILKHRKRGSGALALPERAGHAPLLGEHN